MDEAYVSQMHQCSKYLLCYLPDQESWHASKHGFADVFVEVYIQHLCDDKQVSTKAETVVDLKDAILLSHIPETKLL